MKSASYWALLLCLSSGPALAGKPVRYDCHADTVADQFDVSREEGELQFRDIKQMGLTASFTLLYQTGASTLVAQARYTHQDTLKNTAPIFAGPFLMARSFLDRTRYDNELEFDRDISWAFNREPFDRYWDAPQTIYESQPGTSLDRISLFLPFQLERMAPPKFPFEAYVLGNPGRVVPWKKSYRGYCRFKPLSEEDFERAEHFAAAGRADPATSLVRPPLGVEVMASQEATEELARSRRTLRAYLPTISEEAFAATAGGVLAGLLAREVIKSAPAVQASLQRASAAVTGRLAAREAGAVAARGTLGRAFAFFGGPVLAALALGAEAGPASAQDARFGGPGYHYTYRGLRQLVSGNDESFALFTKYDPALRAYLNEWARAGKSDAK